MKVRLSVAWLHWLKGPKAITGDRDLFPHPQDNVYYNSTQLRAVPNSVSTGLQFLVTLETSR